MLGSFLAPNSDHPEIGEHAWPSGHAMATNFGAERVLRRSGKWPQQQPASTRLRQPDLTSDVPQFCEGATIDIDLPRVHLGEVRGQHVRREGSRRGPSHTIGFEATAQFSSPSGWTPP